MPDIIVACKLPHGLHLDVPGKGRVTLKGTALPEDVRRENPLPGGFSLTSVDADFYAAWLKRNEDLEAVKRGFVFASARRDAAQGQARELDELETGLERLDPEKPPPGLERLDRAS